MSETKLSIEELKDVHILVHMHIMTCKMTNNIEAALYYDNISNKMAKMIVECEMNDSIRDQC